MKIAFGSCAISKISHRHVIFLPVFSGPAQANGMNDLRTHGNGYGQIIAVFWDIDSLTKPVVIDDNAFKGSATP